MGWIQGVTHPLPAGLAVVSVSPVVSVVMLLM